MGANTLGHGKDLMYHGLDIDGVRTLCGLPRGDQLVIDVTRTLSHYLRIGTKYKFSSGSQLDLFLARIPDEATVKCRRDRGLKDDPRGGQIYGLYDIGQTLDELALLRDRTVTLPADPVIKRVGQQLSIEFPELNSLPWMIAKLGNYCMACVSTENSH